MNEQDHKSRRDELAAYLLGALDPGEAAELEQHVADCEECREELEWLRPAVQVLPEAVERVEPPGELRARLMAEVGADAERAPSRPSRSRLAAWLSGLGPRPAVAVAVVLVAVAGAAGYAIRSGGSGGGKETTVTAGRAPGVTAKFVREGESGTLRLANVRELPSGKVLEAWVRRGGKVEPADALFVPNGDGTATTAIDHMAGVNAVMVTAEPRGGSAYPTSNPIVAVPIPQ
jgi:anti-sigma-K factor RskA